MEQKIFRRGSTTYYWASKFFPKAVRRDVSRLYSFLRVVDDLVDQTPPDRTEFYRLKKEWEKGRNKERVIANILRLQKEDKVKPEWVSSFFDAMESDLTVKGSTFHALDDVLGYSYGSAEVVGLMMASIMQLESRDDSGQPHFDAEQGGREEQTEPYRRYGEGAPQRANTVQREKHQGKGGFTAFESDVMRCARVQGRAMQWLNFIRDVEEDNHLGRTYFPLEDLKKFGLKDLSQKTAQSQQEDFTKFMQFQIARYKKWQQEAESGYQYIPKRLRIPVQTAAELYLWTADQIAKNPLIIFECKVKPTKVQIFRRIVLNAL